MLLTPATSPPWRFRLMALTALAALVVVIVVANAAIARRNDRQWRAALVADLRRLDDLQLAWDARVGSFAVRIAPVGDDSTLAFAASTGVILRFESRSPNDWSAVAESEEPLAIPQRCGIYQGDPATPPHRAMTRPGEVSCW